ncbi:MAG: prepilin peptidase, partial [Myxococcales bacterium]|nr:prepilin peptidase [Myxococcales bacterium]
MDLNEGLALLLLPPVGWGVAAVWGALWGSFFNVCIYRIPLYESLTSPSSRCPHCGGAIAWYDNIPIVSWLLLRGRCRKCQAPISPRYILVELLTTVLTLLLYHRFVAEGPGPLGADLLRFIVYFYFTGTLVVLSGIDLDHQLLPDSITYPAIPLFFLLGRLVGDVPWVDAAVGLVAGYLMVRLISDGYYHLTGREGMGYGDGKLLSMVGALMGWRALPLTLLVA